MTKKLLVICVLALTAASLSACGNTAQGFGKDMENAGRNIQDAVDK